MTSAVLPATIRADRLREVLRMFDDDFESIDDMARGEGFFIDDDGHWVPLEDAEEYGLDFGDDLNLYDENDDDYNEELGDWDE